MVFLKKNKNTLSVENLHSLDLQESECGNHRHQYWRAEGAWLLCVAVSLQRSNSSQTRVRMMRCLRDSAMRGKLKAVSLV